MIPFPTGYSMGGVRIEPATVLAPMAGVTDTVFRRLIRNQGGCGLIMTEFTSSHGVLAAAKPRKRPSVTAHYLHFEPEEHPISAQLFGSDPDVMAGAARVCEDLGFDAVDINFGCPVKKVVRCNGGSGLLRDMPLVDTLLKRCREAIKIPLTMKFRSGWNEREHVYLQMARMAEDNGLQAIALHPRTREQGYAGRSNWLHIAEVKAAVKIPVIGNGDVRTSLEAERMFAETGCDAVMIGRAALGNPFIFRELWAWLSRGEHIGPPTVEERVWAARRHTELQVELLGDDRGVREMRGLLPHYVKAVADAAKLRHSLTQVRSVQEIHELLDRVLAVAGRAEENRDTLLPETEG